MIVRLTAEDGKEYYVDPNTGESTWTKPVEFSWVQAQSEDHGREYYHNTVTQVTQCIAHKACMSCQLASRYSYKHMVQESVWEKPEPLFWKQVPWSDPISTEL